MPPKVNPTAAADLAGPAPLLEDGSLAGNIAPEDVEVSVPSSAAGSALSSDAQRVLRAINECITGLGEVRDQALTVAESLRSLTMAPATRREKNGELKEQVDDFTAMKKLIRTFRGVMRQYIDAVVSGNSQVRGEMKRIIDTAAGIRTSTEPDNVFNRPMREFLGMSTALQNKLEAEYRTRIIAAENRLFTMLEAMARGLSEVSSIIDNDEMMGRPAKDVTAELAQASGLIGDDGITCAETREIQQRRYLRYIRNAFKLFASKMEAATTTVDADLGPGLWMLQSKKPCCGKPVAFAVEAGLSAGVGELVRALTDIKQAYLSAAGVEDKHIKSLRKACQKFYQLPLEKILGVVAELSEAEAILACRSKLDELLFAEILPDTCRDLFARSPQGRDLISCFRGDLDGVTLVSVFANFERVAAWSAEAGRWLSEVTALLPRIRDVHRSLPQNSEENKVLLRHHDLLLERSMNISLHAAAYGLLSPADANHVVTNTACLRDEAVRAIVEKYANLEPARLNALKFEEVFQWVSAEVVSELQRISASHVILLKLVLLAVQAAATTERMQKANLEFGAITSHYENISQSLASYATRIQQVVGNIAVMLQSGWSSKADLMSLQDMLRDALTAISTCTEGLELFCQNLKIWRGLSDDVAPVRAIGEVSAALTEQRTVIEGLVAQFRDNSSRMPATGRGDNVPREVKSGSEAASIAANTALVREFSETIQVSLTTALSSGGIFGGSGRLGAAIPEAAAVPKGPSA